MKWLFGKLFGFIWGEVTTSAPDEGFVKVDLPFVPRRVFLDYEVIGVGCMASDCEIRIEKGYKSFTIFYKLSGNKVQFKWLATRF